VNEENKRANIQEEMQSAAEARKAAELLFVNGFVKDAVSKLYYFLLYGVRALLLAKGVEPKSHEGALRRIRRRIYGESIGEHRRI
jgi:uncharacterized protein (UPF0332 family)